MPTLDQLNFEKGNATPAVTELRVVPVAGRDSMLLNLSGAHGPFFTRNLVILKDNSGHTGAGEVPGGEKIRQTLEDSKPFVVGQPIGAYNSVLNAVREKFADRDSGGRRGQNLPVLFHDTDRRDLRLFFCNLRGGAVSRCLRVRSRRSRQEHERDNGRGQLQYNAKVDFDRQDFFRVRVHVQSSTGSGEVTSQVEATPQGFGRWDLLFYLAPFFLIVALFYHGVRKKRKKLTQKLKAESSPASSESNANG